MKQLTKITLLTSSLFLIGCGGGGGSSTTSTDSSSGSSSSTPQTKTGYFIDAAVQGLDYNTSSQLTGTTNAQGEFSYKEGDEVSFYIGKLSLGSGKPESTGLIKPATLTKNDATKTTLLLRTLQGLDDDNNASNGIRIQNTTRVSLDSIPPKRFDELEENELINLNDDIKRRLDTNNDGVIDVSDNEANRHHEDSLQTFENENRERERENDNEDDDNRNTTGTTT